MSLRPELEGKVALVTGAGRNIGRAIALEFATAGAAVAVVTNTNSASGRSVTAEARALGVRAESYSADVTDPAAVAALLESVDRDFGRLDILVNNAAKRTEVAFDELSLDEWRDVLAVSLDGAFICSQAALRLLAASDAGAIVNIGGLTAHTGAARRAHVVTAKAGLVGLTRTLAVELAPLGITVNLVAPGMIDTMRDGETPHHRSERTTPVGRNGTPHEVAAAVRYLSGPGARYVTGQTLHVNGGAYLS